MSKLENDLDIYYAVVNLPRKKPYAYESPAISSRTLSSIAKEGVVIIPNEKNMMLIFLKFIINKNYLESR